MKKNLGKKALLPAIAMVLASVIALSGVTYAWFTTGNTAQVESLDVNVQTANGIQISLDAANWKSTITAQNIKDAAKGSVGTVQYPSDEGVDIAPVSSALNVVDGKLEMFYGEYNKDGTLKSERQVEQSRTSDGDFIAFDLYFKSSGEQDLTLELGDSKSYVKAIDPATGEFDYTIGTEKATRIAFLPMGNAADVAGARALKGSGDILVWEPGAETRASSVDAESGKLAYYGFNQSFEAKAESELGEGSTYTTYIANNVTFNADQVIIHLMPGINKVRVYIWLEGQDVDCVNDISFGDFRVNLFFSVPEVEG